MNTRSARSASRTQQPKALPEKTRLQAPEETKVVTKNPKKRKIEETTSSVSNPDAKGANPKNSAKRRKPNPSIAKKKPTKPK
jgi:DNA mismatch repair protein MSH6